MDLYLQDGGNKWLFPMRFQCVFGVFWLGFHYRGSETFVQFLRGITLSGWEGVGTNPSRNYSSKFFIPVQGADSLTQGFHYRNFVGGGGKKKLKIIK